MSGPLPRPGEDPYRALLKTEYVQADQAWRKGDIPTAWHHLERAHIIAQPLLLAHASSHFRILRFALRLGDWPEVLGQVVRLTLAPIGNLFKRLLVGNTGMANVSAFAPMQVLKDLEKILKNERAKRP